jgi:hypothetical protein
MHKLESFYEGEHFSVYYIASQARLPLLDNEEIEKARVWEPGQGMYPNRIDWNKVLYYVEDGGVPEGIEFVENLEDEEWAVIPNLVTSGLALRVPEIPAIFCLNWRSFVVEKSKIYELPTEKTILNFHYNDQNFLRELDRWGLVPKRLELMLLDRRRRCRGYVEGGLPVGIAKTEIVYSTARVDIRPIKEKTYPDVPLRKDPFDHRRCWIVDEENLFWTLPLTIHLSSEEVKRAFNIVTNQPFEIRPAEREEEGFLIPLKKVESVESKRPIVVYLEGEYALCWRNAREGILIDSIKLKEPHFFQQRSALIGYLGDLPQFLETHNLVKLTKKLLAGKAWFEVYYIEDGELKVAQGRYASWKDTFPSKSSLEEERKKRTALLSKLQHVLPGDPLEWKEEQYLEYDQLLRSGEYTSKPCIQLGMFRYRPVSNALLDLYTKAGGIANQFESRPVSKKEKPKTIVLYRILSLADILKQAEKNDTWLEEYGFVRTMYLLAQRNFPHEYQQEILEKVFNPEVNQQLLNSSRLAEGYFEHTMLALSALRVSREVIVEAFATYLNLPQVSRVLLHNQCSKKP